MARSPLFMSDLPHHIRNTVRLNASSVTDIKHAATLLRDGKIVALPTETVYGLGADATNPSAVREIFSAKGRPTNHPLIVHVLSEESAKEWASSFNAAAQCLASHFWPGPLTLLVSRSAKATDVITGARTTVAVRVPSHPVMREVLLALDPHGFGAVAAPSANTFGSVSPTTAVHVLDDLDGRIDAILDAGPCSVGVESTIIDCSGEVPLLLRPGGVTYEAAMLALQDINQYLEVSKEVESRAPGMLKSHYAPVSPVELFETEADLSQRQRLAVENQESVITITGPPDLEVFATRLYSLLREADSHRPHAILVLLPPAHDLGVAIRDRLTKASAAH